MPHSVSVPEKTLEHWSSQYITYRYRSKVALWWPARGEDIDFGWLPERPGKAVQLELKTTTVVGDGIHDVMVDLGQLWQYRQRPLGHQPFYSFPRPDSDWGGNLAAAAIAKGRAVTELGFARSGSGWWFADWMIVLTAAEVAAVLHKELAAHGSKKPKKERLVRFDHSKPGPVWGSGTHPAPVGWREFWPALEHCGRIGWPQLIRLPARLTRTRGPYPSSQVAEMLREAAEMPTGQADTGEPLVTLEPDADGTFQVTLVPTDNAGRPDEDEVGEEVGNEEDSDHRQIIFLDAGALLRSR